MFVPLFSRPGWQRASGEGEVLWSGESRPGRVRRCGRDLGCNRGAREREVWSRVETWMQPGSEKARSVVESRDLDATSKRVRESARDLDATSQASAKIYSRPGCNEQASAKICSRPVRRDLDGSSVKVRFGASRLRMPRKPNTA
ncbi:unnamed protein product [Sphagnum troendelagicum]|uniref:Uncharacterized protein n=1 Tax=Sphagnum troendelagicum TaxID=128251 RepID=A0ABP0UXH4_9BRYO